MLKTSLSEDEDENIPKKGTQCKNVKKINRIEIIFLNNFQMKIYKTLKYTKREIGLRSFFKTTFRCREKNG